MRKKQEKEGSKSRENISKIKNGNVKEGERKRERWNG